MFECWEIINNLKPIQYTQRTSFATCVLDPNLKFRSGYSKNVQVVPMIGFSDLSDFFFIFVWTSVRPFGNIMMHADKRTTHHGIYNPTNTSSPPWFSTCSDKLIPWRSLSSPSTSAISASNQTPSSRKLNSMFSAVSVNPVPPQTK